MPDKRPIGVFDSGLGGVSVLKQLLRILPDENYIYLGDTARVPYGNKSRETIREYSVECTDFLLSKDCKLVVVACNTASSVAIPPVCEAAGEVPVIEMIVPAAKAAVEKTRNGRVGIIGTRATISSGEYRKRIGEYAGRHDKAALHIFEKACPLFVPLVEEGLTDHPATEMIAADYLRELAGSHIDTLVLGCTHYPFLGGLIRKVLPGVALIDTGEEAAMETERVLREKDLAVTGENDKGLKVGFYVTDTSGAVHSLAEEFLGMKLEEIHRAFI